MIKNLVIAILSLASAALAIACVRQHFTIGEMMARLERTEKQSLAKSSSMLRSQAAIDEKGRRLATKAATSAAGDPLRRRNSSNASTAGASAAPSTSGEASIHPDTSRPVSRQRGGAIEKNTAQGGDAGAQDSRRGGGPWGGGPGGGFREILASSPEARESFRLRMKQQVENGYSKIIEENGISGDRLESFKNLMAERQLALFESGRDGNADEIRKQYDAKLQELLDAGTYDALKNFESTSMERDTVSVFRQGLPADAQLTPAMSDELAKMMSEERQAMNEGKGFNFDPRSMHGLDAAAIRGKLDQLGELHQSYIDKASQILSKEQTDVLSATLAGQRAFMEAMAKRAAEHDQERRQSN